MPTRPSLRQSIRRRLGEKDVALRLRDAPTVYRLLSLFALPPSEIFRRRAAVQEFLSVAPFTMLSFPKVVTLQACCDRVRTDRIPGDVVECGVWKGGAAALLIRHLRADTQRQFWLYDSWEGLPPATALDVRVDGLRGQAGLFSASQDRVEKLLFSQERADPSRVHLVPGWFESTLVETVNRERPIALLHIDCDYYQSVRFCLEHLYPFVAPGGVVLIDDYADWAGCRRAVDEFLVSEGRGAATESHGDAGFVITKPGRPKPETAEN